MTMAVDSILATLNRIAKDQRFILLLGMIMVYLLWEFMRSSAGGSEYLHMTIISVLMMAAIGCLRFKRQSFLTSRIFGVLVLLLGWVQAATDAVWLDRVDGLFRSLFFLVVTGALIYQVARTARASWDLIVGAINGYLLLGIVGGVVARVIDGIIPGAFRFDPEIHLGASKYLYFSYISLATVGYGDITPLVPSAQLLSIVLGVSGQLYVATIIAVLVGKYLSGKPATD